MKISSIFTLVILSASLFGAKVFAASTGRYLVLMKSQISEKNLASSLKGAQIEEHLVHLNAVVVSAQNTEFQKLSHSKDVLLIEPEIFHPLPQPIRSGLLNLAVTQRFKEKQAEDTVSGFGLVPTLPWGIKAVKAREAWSMAKKGQGARVLVLDTGIDKDHPSLIMNFEKGQDFVGDEQEPYAFVDKIGHGTHVAGTIAGALNLSGFTGVAPEAKILAGRVCSQDGCSNISIARGVDWGIAENVDVISMSLGGPMSTPGERIAISRAIESHISVVAATGNDGTNRVSYPAALDGVIAVGAVDILLKKAQFSQYGPEVAVVAPGVDVVSTVPAGTGRKADVQLTVDENLPFATESLNIEGSAEVPQPVENSVVYAGLGRPEDFEKVEVKGKFALVARGEIKFIEKVENAIAAGATGLIIHNNAPGLVNATLGMTNGNRVAIPVFVITQAVGEALKEALEKQSKVSARLAVEITSYTAMDGTSMATPHVSGVVALMKAANKSLTPEQVRSILRNTAFPLGPNANNEFGAGLINAEEAVRQALGLALEPRN
jgi:serine protease